MSRPMKGEGYWLTSACPAALFYESKRLPNRRKVRTARRVRLFCCGCYRLVWDRIKLADTRKAVEAVEDWADGLISRDEMLRSRYPRGNAPLYSPDGLLRLSLAALMTPKLTPDHVADLVRSAADPEKYRSAGKWGDCPEQAELVREVFGNPYRPVEFDPGWRTSTAVELARRMYEGRDFGAMPILADALQDAGCENSAILDHCRKPGAVHARGCWVVDLVLGKS